MSTDRLRLIDSLASGDGQHWPDLFQNADQQQIAETMYGPQADAVLASAWLADRDAAEDRLLLLIDAEHERHEAVRDRLIAERDAALAQIAAVREVHSELREDTSLSYAGYCAAESCGVLWPCPTIAALGEGVAEPPATSGEAL